MIELYAGPTPNAWKVSVMLEEYGLPYRVHYIDMLGGDQFKPEFLAINPNNKQPAIVDPDGAAGAPLTLWESGAILIHFAEKTGRFLAKSGTDRAHALQWLMFQMSGIGPMFGQLHHFVQYAPDQIPYAIERYRKEVDRLRAVMNRHLEQREHLAGDYSIADIACFPWIRAMWKKYPPGIDMPHLQRWSRAIGARPAVQKGMSLLVDRTRPEAKGEKRVDEQMWNVLFGSIQHGTR